MARRSTNQDGKTSSGGARARKADPGALSAAVAELRAELAGVLTRLAALEAARGLEAATSEPAAAPPAIAASPGADPKTEIGALIARLLAVAIASGPDGRQGFGDFLDLVHSSRRGSPILEDSLRRYTWPQICRNASRYLDDPGRPESFHLVRFSPADPGPEGQIRAFVYASSRMPVPVLFDRDPAAGGCLRIVQCSL